MRLSVSGDRVNVGSRLREYIDRHLHFALGRFGPAIDHVVAGRSVGGHEWTPRWG